MGDAEVSQSGSRVSGRHDERRILEIALFLVRRDRSEVLLLHRVPRLGGFWHVVAGGIDAGEAWQDATERELREETGLELSEIECCGSALFSYAVDPRLGQDPRGIVRADRVDVRCVLAEVADDWVPTLNWEHDDHLWCSPERACELLRWRNLADALAEMLGAGGCH